MKKIILSIVIFFIILLVFLILVLLYKDYKVDKRISEEKLPEIEEYLKNKYDEEMVIYDYSTYDGFLALVYPKNNKDNRFTVTYWYSDEKYVDDYIEISLENEATSILNDKLKEILIIGTDCLDYHFFMLLELPPPRDCGEYLYEKYKDIQIPISWKNPECTEKIDELSLEIENGDIDLIKSKVIDIRDAVKSAGIPYNKFEIYCDNVKIY